MCELKAGIVEKEKSIFRQRVQTRQVWSCYQAATSESVKDFLCAVVAAAFRAYESVTVISL